ncbi:helix-turn-helix domain-containing protein [Bradyrhizobium sp. 159]|uniref:helix-turn-helix transcriptional regulator n=1 Tax=Bradyrhizobium sp. 159 TaxID=2782632 RepID=UPI001FF95318|nr:helix-turn-helix domain-containing protein [Bradyrhizobium sp. 159]MCK1619547.1 helix-turn-helix domain-containing protein [Bradyrhizobium sp. 159]
MLTVDEFCQRYRICRATFYRLRAEGKGPRIVKIGKCTRISEAAASEWLAANELVAA